MESEGEAIPVTQKEENNLSGAEAYIYLTKAGHVYKNFTWCTNPPAVQPKRWIDIFILFRARSIEMGGEQEEDKVDCSIRVYLLNECSEYKFGYVLAIYFVTQNF